MTTPVEDLLVERGIPFNFSGHDLLIRCLNPEHPDKNPSLRVDKLTGMLHCFSCGFKGNIFSHFGIVQNFQSVEIQRIKDKIQAIFSESVGLEMPFGFSYYDKPFRGISVRTLRYYEAFTHKDFENRIVFPLRDSLGKIKVFIARHLFAKPSDGIKRYDIKPSGVQVPFFPHNPILENGTLVLVEGLFDALNLIDNGMTNVISVNGLQTLNPKNISSKLATYRLMGCSRIVTMFDNDDAGKKHTDIMLPALKEAGFLAEPVEWKNLEYKDPGELPADLIKELKKALKYANSGNRQTT